MSPRLGCDLVVSGVDTLSFQTVHLEILRQLAESRVRAVSLRLGCDLVVSSVQPVHLEIAGREQGEGVSPRHSM